jgi:glycosyltransferase involved in cell wall biosynthesis
LSPDISYIVSAYNKPELLPCVLHSLNVQTHQDFEVIVADNSTDAEAAREHRAIVAGFDKRFRYALTRTKVKVPECYNAAEWVAKNMARGKWLCFPCDDCYYVPQFGARMLAHAIKKGLDLVKCHLLFSQWGEAHRVFESVITVKSAFMVRAQVFPGFNAKPKRIEACSADSVLGVDMEREGFKTAALPEILVVHN